MIRTYHLLTLCLVPTSAKNTSPSDDLGLRSSVSDISRIAPIVLIELAISKSSHHDVSQCASAPPAFDKIDQEVLRGYLRMDDIAGGWYPLVLRVRSIMLQYRKFTSYN